MDKTYIQNEEKIYGVPRKPLSNTPKKERIMEVVERVITNIQSDVRGTNK